MPQLNYGAELTETFHARDALTQGAFALVWLHLAGVALVRLCARCPHWAHLALLTGVLLVAGGLADLWARGKGYGTRLGLGAAVGLAGGVALWALPPGWLLAALENLLGLVWYASLGACLGLALVHVLRVFLRRGDSGAWLALLGWGFTLLWLSAKLWPVTFHLFMPFAHSAPFRFYALVVAWWPAVATALETGKDTRP